MLSRLTEVNGVLAARRPGARPAAVRGEPRDQRPGARPGDQHALRRHGRQHQHGRAVEQLRATSPSTRCRRRSSPSTSTRSATRPTTCRRSTTRTAPGHGGRRRPVRRQRRQEPGEAASPAARSRSTRPASATPTTSCITKAGNDCTRSTTAPTPAGARPRSARAPAATCTNAPAEPGAVGLRRAAPRHRARLLRRPPQPDPRQPRQHVQRARTRSRRSRPRTRSSATTAQPGTSANPGADDASPPRPTA